MNKLISYRNAVPILIGYYIIRSIWQIYETQKFFSLVDPTELKSELTYDLTFTLFILFVIYKFLLISKPWNHLELSEKFWPKLVSSFLISFPVEDFYNYLLKIANVISEPPPEAFSNIGPESYDFLFRAIAFSFVPNILILVLIYYKFSEKFASKAFEKGGVLWKGDGK